MRFRLVVPVFRSGRSAEYTARGVANGVFWGLTPTIGLQTFEIVATWLVARKVFRKDSSLLQANLWVWINNPLTMIPMYYAFYVTGLWLIGQSGPTGGYRIFVELWTSNAEAGWLARGAGILRAIGVPLVIGCLPYASVASALSYRWALGVVRRRRQKIRLRVAGAL